MKTRSVGGKLLVQVGHESIIFSAEQCGQLARALVTHLRRKPTPLENYAARWQSDTSKQRARAREFSPRRTERLPTATTYADKGAGI